MSLNVWLDCLYSELKHHSLLDFVQNDNTEMDQETWENKNSETRDIIINHLDDYYHNKVISIKNAKEILQKIKSSRAAEVNLNSTSVRAKLYQLKKSNKETVNQFCDRFDEVIREYEISSNGTPLAEIEKSAASYQAVTPVHTELQSANLIQRQNGKEMNLEQMKNFLLQLESERRNDRGNNPVRANVAYHNGQQRGPERVEACYRCTKKGHRSSNCPLTEYNLWFCFVCQGVRDHKGDTCPKNQSQDVHTVKKNNYNNIERFREKAGGSRGRGNGRGRTPRGRGNLRGRGNFNNPTSRKNNSSQRGNTKNQKPQHQGTRAYAAGNYNTISTNQDNKITFLADSGATEHIIHKAIVISNFQKSFGDNIKCANKNESANIKIDGRGDLILGSNLENNKSIKLRVVQAKDVSENPISLRKFADLGLAIYLDDRRRIFVRRIQKTKLVDYTTRRKSLILNSHTKTQTQISVHSQNCYTE